MVLKTSNDLAFTSLIDHCPLSQYTQPNTPFSSHGRAFALADPSSWPSYGWNFPCSCLSKDSNSSERSSLTPLWNEAPTATVTLYHMIFLNFLYSPYHYLKLSYLFACLCISFIQQNKGSTRADNLTSLFTDVFSGSKTGTWKVLN